MNPFAEQEAWEEHQIGKLSLLFFFTWFSFWFLFFVFWAVSCMDFVSSCSSNVGGVIIAGKATLKYGSKNKKQISDEYQ